MWNSDRNTMVNDIWIPKINEFNVPCTPKFSFSEFLSKPTIVREWNINGLPSDAFSTENGVIVTKGEFIKLFQYPLVKIVLLE